MKIHFFILVFFVISFIQSHATVLPPNHLNREDNEFAFSPSAIDEDIFNSIIDETVAPFEPLAEKFDGRIEVQKNWSDPTVNAGARQLNGRWILIFFGGLARRPELSKDSFQLSICHELGHHFGGYPYTKNNTWVSSNEGEADYFATQVCLRQLWKDQSQVNRTFREGVSAIVQSRCDKVWKKSGDQELCYRIAHAGLELANLLNKTGRDPSPAFETPDSKQVDQTSDSHPKGQCRLDTYISGSLCAAENTLELIPGKNVEQGVNSPEAESEAAKASCFLQSGFKIGLRPRCWFAPLTEKYRDWVPKWRAPSQDENN